jgi:hypothetical protein
MLTAGTVTGVPNLMSSAKALRASRCLGESSNSKVAVPGSIAIAGMSRHLVLPAAMPNSNL